MNETLVIQCRHYETSQNKHLMSVRATELPLGMRLMRSFVIFKLPYTFSPSYKVPTFTQPPTQITPAHLITTSLSGMSLKQPAALFPHLSLPPTSHPFLLIAPRLSPRYPSTLFCLLWRHKHTDSFIGSTVCHSLFPSLCLYPLKTVL